MEDFKVPEEHLKASKVVKYASLKDTTFVEVYTEEQFNLMVSDLRSVCELAIDLEVKCIYFFTVIFYTNTFLLFKNRHIAIVLIRVLHA